MKVNVFGKEWEIYFCHQKPERSFEVNGRQFPLCARCTGLIAGILISVLLLPTLKTYGHFLMGLLTLPLILDGFSQELDLRKSNNILRFFTGNLFSIGIATVIWGVL